MRAFAGLRWLFNRRVGAAVLWAALIVTAALLVNVAGIHVVGGVEAWARWLQTHALYFFAWRLGLYAVTAYGWWWMRRRLRQRESDAETQRRLVRAEVAALIAVVLLEGSQLLLHR